jgi:MYXO-CTERM domain-containing protein
MPLMRRSLLPLLFPIAACVPGADTSTSSKGIVGGVTDTGDPAVVIVDLGNGLCSGTVISPHVVLTAGHCIEAASNTSIRFENTFGDGTGPTIPASETLQHPLYNQGDDIGLIAMSAAAPTAAIPYNTADLSSHLGEAVRIVGFGVTSENGNDSGIKRQGTASLYMLLTENGGEVETTNQPQGTCYGDSGGPNFMTINGTEQIAGITTTGTDICGSGYDIGTDVSKYTDWINTFVQAHDSGTQPPPDAGPTARPDGGIPDNNPDAGGNPANGDQMAGGCCSSSGAGGASGAFLLVGFVALGIRRRKV